jgi:hypothetical protein
VSQTIARVSTDGRLWWLEGVTDRADNWSRCEADAVHFEDEDVPLVLGHLRSEWGALLTFLDDDPDPFPVEDETPVPVPSCSSRLWTLLGQCWEQSWRWLK